MSDLGVEQGDLHPHPAPAERHRYLAAYQRAKLPSKLTIVGRSAAPSQQQLDGGEPASDVAVKMHFVVQEPSGSRLVVADQKL